MIDEPEGRSRTTVHYVADLVAVYVTNNQVFPSDLPALIATVHASLAGLSPASNPSTAEAKPELPTPDQIRKSITPNALISFIDGKPYKTLKRHLTKHGFDPQTYRTRYGLPVDYPIVAASYSARRANISRNVRPYKRG